MVNSKLEKVLLVLVWYALLITFRFVLPISAPPSDIDKYVVIFLSVLVTIIVYRMYVHYRNKHILKTVNILLEENRLDEATRYINKCLSKHKSSSVYAYKLYALAMCGRITEFEKMLSECNKSNKYKKIVGLDFVRGLVSIISYFKTCNSTTVSVNQQSWAEIVNTLLEEEIESSIPNLLNAYSNATFGIIKSVFAFKLHFIYLKIGDIEKAERYHHESLKYAPSLEVAYYIEHSRNLECGGENTDYGSIT